MLSQFSVFYKMLIILKMSTFSTIRPIYQTKAQDLRLRSLELDFWFFALFAEKSDFSEEQNFGQPEQHFCSFCISRFELCLNEIEGLESWNGQITYAKHLWECFCHIKANFPTRAPLCCIPSNSSCTVHNMQYLACAYGYRFLFIQYTVSTVMKCTLLPAQLHGIHSISNNFEGKKQFWEYSLVKHTDKHTSTFGGCFDINLKLYEPNRDITNIAFSSPSRIFSYPNGYTREKNCRADFWLKAAALLGPFVFKKRTKKPFKTSLEKS